MTYTNREEFFAAVERARQEGAARSRGRVVGEVHCWRDGQVIHRICRGEKECSLEALERRIAKLIKANADQYRQRHPRRWLLCDLRAWLTELGFSSRRIEGILWRAWNKR